MIIYRSTDPASDPITRAIAEERLALGADFDQNVIDNLISEATTQVELDTNISVMQQEWTLALQNWPRAETIHLPKGPLDESTGNGISSFTYTDGSGATQTLIEDTDFRVSAVGDKIRLTPIGNGWPVDVADREDYPDPIKIVYDTGKSTADGWQISAVLIRIHYLYTLGQIDSDKAYQSIIKKHKDYTNYYVLNAEVWL